MKSSDDFWNEERERFTRFFRQLSDLERAKLLLDEWDGFDHIYEHKWRALKLIQKYVAVLGPYGAHAVALLPEHLTVYRGTDMMEWATVDFGISWTIQKDEAKRFASHYRRHRSESPILMRARIDKRHVLAYLVDAQRQECEVILDPEHLRRHYAIDLATGEPAPYF